MSKHCASDSKYVRFILLRCTVVCLPVLLPLILYTITVYVTACKYYNSLVNTLAGREKYTLLHVAGTGNHVKLAEVTTHYKTHPTDATVYIANILTAMYCDFKNLCRLCLRCS